MNTQDLFSLKGRCALITGGSRGIGRMIAEGFLTQGARVYITARKAEACEATARELLQFGSCVALPGDVSTSMLAPAVSNALKPLAFPTRIIPSKASISLLILAALGFVSIGMVIAENRKLKI